MKTRLRRNKAKSYYAYIAENGLQEDGGEDIVGRAKRDLAFSDTRYGALGSALSRSGLFDGGYEEYLRSVNSENYADEMRRAKEESMLAEGRRTGGYESYLSSYDKMQSKISEAFIKEMRDGEIYDIERLYELAAERGLSEDNALYTAAAALRESSLNATERIISFAARYGLSPKQTVNYAKTFGLKSYYIDKIEKTVSTFSGYVADGGMGYSDYLDYIKDKYTDK